MTSGIEDLKSLVRRLDALLAEPQPGLFTWHMMLSDLIYDIGQYGGRDIIMGKEK